MVLSYQNTSKSSAQVLFFFAPFWFPCVDKLKLWKEARTALHISVPRNASSDYASSKTGLNRSLLKFKHLSISAIIINGSLRHLPNKSKVKFFRISDFGDNKTLPRRLTLVAVILPKPVYI